MLLRSMALGLFAEKLFLAFVAAMRYNLFAQMQQKGFPLLSASPWAVYLFSTFIEAEIGENINCKLQLYDGEKFYFISATSPKGDVAFLIISI